MTRRLLVVAITLVTLLGGCGRYGPPVRAGRPEEPTALESAVPAAEATGPTADAPSPPSSPPTGEEEEEEE